MWRRYYGGARTAGTRRATGPEPAERDLARLTAGRGKLSRALGIDRSFDGVDLTDGAGPIFLAWGDEVADGDVVTTTRIGITKGADFPWRFYVRASPSVSRR
jgi:DNA-3-methyladenine glycosylase